MGPPGRPDVAGLSREMVRGCLRGADRVGDRVLGIAGGGCRQRAGAPVPPAPTRICTTPRSTTVSSSDQSSRVGDASLPHSRTTAPSTPKRREASGRWPRPTGRHRRPARRPAWPRRFAGRRRWWCARRCRRCWTRCTSRPPPGSPRARGTPASRVRGRSAAVGSRVISNIAPANGSPPELSPEDSR
jgi:hypothetical protein